MLRSIQLGQSVCKCEVLSFITLRCWVCKKYSKPLLFYSRPCMLLWVSIWVMSGLTCMILAQNQLRDRCSLIKGWFALQGSKGGNRFFESAWIRDTIFHAWIWITIACFIKPFPFLYLWNRISFFFFFCNKISLSGIPWMTTGTQIATTIRKVFLSYAAAVPDFNDHIVFAVLLSYCTLQWKFCPHHTLKICTHLVPEHNDPHQKKMMTSGWYKLSKRQMGPKSLFGLKKQKKTK